LFLLLGHRQGRPRVAGQLALRAPDIAKVRGTRHPVAGDHGLGERQVPVAELGVMEARSNDTPLQEAAEGVSGGSWRREFKRRLIGAQVGPLECTQTSHTAVSIKYNAMIPTNISARGSFRVTLARKTWRICLTNINAEKPANISVNGPPG